MSEHLSVQTGMRPSLEGTQARGEGESHTQDANVAEVSYGETVMVESEYPETIGPPGGRRERVELMAPLTRRHKSDKQVTNGVVGSKAEGMDLLTLLTKTPR
jgi:hypothetical protein